MFKRGTAHVLEAPENGRTVIQIRAALRRFNHEIDFKGM